MNAVLLTLLATLGGTNDSGYTVADSAYSHGEVVYDGGSACGGRGCRSGHCGKGHAPHGGWLGMMPQTCYNPRFGCYDGDRYNHRYPAFHGTYYRRAYNYRNYFDYPWHADLHEPTSNFAYNVNEPGAAIVVPQPAVPTPAPVIPVPAPDTVGSRSGEQAPAPVRPAAFRFGKYNR